MKDPVDRDTALRVLRHHRDDLRRRKMIEVLGIFGSLARGDARPDSDADVLADFLQGTTLFRVAETQIELEALLGRRVDLVDRRGLRSFARAGVERDFIAA